MQLQSFALPYKDGRGVRGKYLFAVGGYHSTDSGCPAWGTSDPSDIRFIGDRFGDITVGYADGSSESVPLILGYTLWLHSVFAEAPAPFFGEYADERLSAALKRTLSLYGAWECAPRFVLRIALRNERVVSVDVSADPEKNTERPVLTVYTVPWEDTEGLPVKKGRPVFSEAYVTDEETLPELGADSAEFFSAHTVTPSDIPYGRITEDLRSVCFALHTFDGDFEKAPEFEAPDAFHPFDVKFSGSPLASIASGAVYHNMKNLCERTDEDGFIHTSYRNAPSWRYDGFGPYVMNANSYYDSFYSRDCGRAIMTLNSFGYTAKAVAACRLGGGFMMAYPRDKVTLGGVAVPGHFSVICNKPYIYSRLLIRHGWPTRYTGELFGEECGNLGNQETDGHGLMMTANYLCFKSLGKDTGYVRENFEYIKECAEWIIWCFEHPELSFAENGLLYGETEAAMNDYTLYANVPCFLGLLGCIEMASAAGKTEEARTWSKYADMLRAGIDRGLTEGDSWKLSKCGFFHDPVLTMLADVYGYDTADMPADWVSRSRNSYKADLEKTVRHGYYGVRGGIGYDHSMITQNALLLDRTKEAGELVNSLCRICYAPRLPEPYLVPEGMSVDAGKGVFRRQGDLANLVQLAEAMKCFHIVIGVSPLNGDVLKIMPRLPFGWSVSVKDFPIQNAAATVDMSTSYPSDCRQSMTLSVCGQCPAGKVAVRFGPFPAGCGAARVSLNGKTYFLQTHTVGDAAWCTLAADIADLS